jgi:diacylglycerol kinase family enzyme
VTRSLVPLLAGFDRPMHLGRTDRGDVVVLMLSAGPDSLIVRDAFRRRRRYDGKLGIAAQAIRELLGRRPLPRLSVRVGDHALDGGWVIVGNSQCFAGNYRATPGADPFAPGFEVVVHRGRGRLSATAFAAGIPFGRHVNRSDVTVLRCNRVTVEPVPGDAPIPYQVDGDPIDGLPVTLEVDSRRLLIRMPASGELDRGEC